MRSVCGAAADLPDVLQGSWASWCFGPGRTRRRSSRSWVCVTSSWAPTPQAATADDVQEPRLDRRAHLPAPQASPPRAARHRGHDLRWHRTSFDDVVRPSSKAMPSTCTKIRYNSRSHTVIMPDRRRSPINPGQQRTRFWNPTGRLNRLDKRARHREPLQSAQSGREPSVSDKTSRRVLPCEPGDCMADRKALGRREVTCRRQPKHHALEAADSDAACF